MRKHVLQIVLIFGFFLLFVRCAQVVPLTGGERDKLPPKLIESSPLNQSLNFNATEIILSFDEFVQLRDLPNQLIISPKLKTQPEVNAKGKQVVISLDPKELLPNTTYRFSFGKAIADMNESNALENFEYIFSTGNNIDSLDVSGVVFDASANRPSSGILIGLYIQDKTTDSLAYLQTPDYTTLSAEGGSFRFTHLPSRNFAITAIADKNKNNLYDGEAEKIAFASSDLKLLSDSTIELQIFQEEPSKVFIKRTVSPFYGLSQIIFNKKTNATAIPLNSRSGARFAETRPGIAKDTLSIYYQNLTDSLQLKVQKSISGATDTINILLPAPNKSKRTFMPLNVNISSGTLPLNDKLRFTFLNWMDTTKTDLKRMKITSNEDTLFSATPLSGRWSDIVTFVLNNKLREGANYSLKIDTGAFYSVHGNSNDSLAVKFKTKSKLEFGKVTLKISLNLKQNYLIQLINEQSDVIREQPLAFSLSSSNAASLDFTNLPPGTYQAKIIFDDNNNQKWDTGNYLLKKQPERVIINSKLLKVLADWEIEEEISEKNAK